MTELKTKKSNASVKAFLKTIVNKTMRADCEAIVEIMKSATKSDPVMWGSSIVGFGSYHYKYASGREGDWFRCGFSPRKQNLTLYLMGGFSMQKDLLAQLGKHKTGKSCLYIKQLADIDLKVLRKMILNSARHPMGEE
jgi:hypothetical protein